MARLTHVGELPLRLSDDADINPASCDVGPVGHDEAAMAYIDASIRPAK